MNVDNLWNNFKVGINYFQSVQIFEEFVLIKQDPSPKSKDFYW